LVEKREGKRPRCRWEDNIKMDLQEVDVGYGLDRAGSGDIWWALVNAVMNLRVP
jgi:hypothetical protein